MHRNQLHLYTPPPREKKEKLRGQSHLQSPFAPKTVRYLGINLTKDAKNLYSENYKVLMKKLRKTQRNGKTFHAHGLEAQIL